MDSEEIKIKDEGSDIDEDLENDDESDDEEMEEEEDEEEEGEEESTERRTYLPGQPLEDGEVLVCDESAYIVYHAAETGSPCLSFDVLRDGLGDSRDSYPLTCYAVAGTQSSHAHTNNVVVMKLSNIHRTKQKKDDDDDDDDDDDSSDEDDDNNVRRPSMETEMIPHNTAVNRIRATCVGDQHIACTWAESGAVHVWDLTKSLKAIENPPKGGANSQKGGAKKGSTKQSAQPLFTFKGHQCEGFAMDWSRLTPGRLVTGDCNKSIHQWQMKDGATWNVDQRPYTGHTQSVEDLQWSPTEPTVFASCSVDKSIRIWDVRAAPHKACMITLTDAHDSDVNVISWNSVEARFIVSGGDDGVLKVWDLAQYKKTDGGSSGSSMSPVAVFKHHTAPITSVEWHPTDSSVFCAAGADDQVTQWDIATEREQDKEQEEEVDVLPQLLFIHQGQKEIKEVHWHPQIPGLVISTALSGFNIFRTISV